MKFGANYSAFVLLCGQLLYFEVYAAYVAKTWSKNIYQRVFNYGYKTFLQIVTISESRYSWGHLTNGKPINVYYH